MQAKNIGLSLFAMLALGCQATLSAEGSSGIRAGATEASSTPAATPPTGAGSAVTELEASATAGAATKAEAAADAKAGTKPEVAADAKTMAEAPAATAAAGTVEGAKQRLAEFTKPGADQAKLVQGLKPSSEDLKAIFDQSVLPAIQSHVDKAYASTGQGFGLKETPDVRCFPSDSIRSWTGDAKQELPGGYQRLGPKVQPGLTFCRFKAGGVSYDALIFVGGHWVFVPKPFRAVRD